MYNTIITQLKTLISSISGINAIYDYEADTYPIYPCVTITPLSRTSEYKTIGGDNERYYSFNIRIIHKLDNSEVDQKQLRELADDLDNLLENKDNISLGGIVNYTKLSEGTFRFITREASLYVYEFVYKVSYLFKR